ncbi:MAG: phenylalanine 4-monooxygenase [Bacteroidetes bacterium]|nr:MAG: phenylalanine 4-monooxygenase [Bacteroidota bacterium]
MTERNRPEQQVYANYTPEDFKVWKTLFNRQYELIEKHASKDYIIALEKIGFTAERIPDFQEVNIRLKNLTGWQLTTVPCISPADKFFNLLSKKTFTATCWLRNFSELDYIEEPDMFHDVFGHAPLLSNPDYVTFFKAMGDIAMKNIHNPQLIIMLQRLYWFTIEFGLVLDSGEIKFYGAGILSSMSETKHALNPESTKKAYNVSEIMQHDFRTDIIQEEYYVIDSFAQLSDSIADIEKEVLKTLT